MRNQTIYSWPTYEIMLSVTSKEVIFATIVISTFMILMPIVNWFRWFEHLLWSLSFISPFFKWPYIHCKLFALTMKTNERYPEM